MTEQEVYFSDLFAKGYSFKIYFYRHVFLHAYFKTCGPLTSPDRLMNHSLEQIVKKE